MIEFHWFLALGILFFAGLIWVVVFKIFQGRVIPYLEDEETYVKYSIAKQGDFVFMVLLKGKESFKHPRLYRLWSSQLKKEGGEELVEVPDRFRVFVGNQFHIERAGPLRQRVRDEVTYHLHKLGPND